MLLIAGVLNRITQEDGSLPGEPLGTFKALVYFVGVPTLLFAVIAAVVLLSTTGRKAKRSTLTRIE
ncbi:MAG: hypothetical protein F2653_04635 [Actinobacteria bacterium]|uniref:Unannotated protein n=1 Tax=freshwater metagenome TaxID=449393 RepID=A0A6J7LBI1_9ZZZZ|nr:hypothetical protein [Actinomycetota bacterium]MSW22826.1 hypothetical protein [Actinomycetota bacterium]MSX04278.1 hypothetical protein [Actinomycetota bacterium]MSX61405.1 hypothetical protein [Actinomycetota bacterium]MSX84170.1 hypothetical protein [Actinomycetota bacterium]